MRTQTITRTVYALQELKAANPRGYEKAMDTLRAYAADHDWWDCVYDDLRDGWRVVAACQEYNEAPNYCAHCGQDIAESEGDQDD